MSDDEERSKENRDQESSAQDPVATPRDSAEDEHPDAGVAPEAHRPPSPPPPPSSDISTGGAVDSERLETGPTTPTGQASASPGDWSENAGLRRYTGKQFLASVIVAFVAGGLLSGVVVAVAGSDDAETSSAISDQEATVPTEGSVTTASTTSTSTSSTTSTTPLPSLTQEVAIEALTGPGRAFASAYHSNVGNVSEAIPALVEAARGLRADHAPLDETGSTWETDVVWIAEGSIVPEGNNAPVVFDKLRNIGVEGIPNTLFGGSHTVGTDVEPGTYVVFDVEGCYWERLDANGEIIDNNFVSAAPRVQATIRPGDFAFNSEGCGRWVEVV